MKSVVAVAVLLFCCTAASFASEQKLIALTFDDGPRPYVLYGVHKPGEPPTEGLIRLLDRYSIKATFFEMGWRLTAKTWGDRREINIGISCIDAARDLARRGNEIENHTYSHEELRGFERRHGSAAALADIKRGSEAIRAAVGIQPKFVRPPDWILPADLRLQIERLGYQVMTISTQNPLAIRDVNSLDYLCAGAHPRQCPRPSLADSVLKQISLREKRGITTHILAFHELSSTVTALQTLIPELKARGYRFVRLDEYMKEVSQPFAPAPTYRSSMARSESGR